VYFEGISTINTFFSIDPDTPNYEIIEMKNQKEENNVANLDELLGEKVNC
jgi:hypothetical protein